MVVARRSSRAEAAQARRRSTTIHHLLFTIYCLFDVRVDRLRVARAVNAAESARALVVVEERARLLLVGREPRLDRLRVVVRAPVEARLRVQVADFVARGRLEVDVVNLAADGAGAAARHALLDDVERHVNEHGDEPVTP